MKIEELYLRTDERNEAIKALEKTIQFLDETQSDIYNWKWFIISLHNCLQAFMVLALKGSNSLSVMRPESAKRWMSAYESDGQYPKVKLELFIELFEKIKSDTMIQYTHSKKFLSNEQIDRSVHDLNELRNKFIHFMPTGWSLNISGLPKLAQDILLILKFIITESGNVYFYDESTGEHVEHLLEELSLGLADEGKYVV